MIQASIVSLTLLLFLTFSGQAQSSPQTDEYLLATQALDQRFTNGMSRMDIEQVMTCFWNSPDVIFVHGTVFRGFDNIRKDVEQMFAQHESLSLVINEVSYIREGESVFAIGTATYEGKTKAGTSQKIVERWTDVRRKVNGRWVYVLDHAHALTSPAN